MPASLYPQVKVVLSCIATQAPGHFAQGWELPYSCLFRAVPGTVTAPHCACLMRGPHFCAACSGSSPGDLVEGGSAPLSREWSQRWPLAWQRTIRRLLITGGHRSTACVCAGQALRPTRQCRGLSSTAVREEHLRKGNRGLQGLLATRPCNMHCILVLLPWGMQQVQHSGRLHVVFRAALPVGWVLMALRPISDHHAPQHVLSGLAVRRG